MADELLIWGAALLLGLGAVITFFWIVRVRQRRKWRSKRPIRIDVRKEDRGPDRQQDGGERL